MDHSHRSIGHSKRLREILPPSLESKTFSKNLIESGIDSNLAGIDRNTKAICVLIGASTPTRGKRIEYVRSTTTLPIHFGFGSDDPDHFPNRFPAVSSFSQASDFSSSTFGNIRSNPEKSKNEPPTSLSIEENFYTRFHPLRYIRESP